MVRWQRWCRIGALALLLTTGALTGSEDVVKKANGLLSKRQYQDVVRLVQPALPSLEPVQQNRAQLILGEAFYCLNQYAEASAAFTQALTGSQDADGRALAQYRLVCISYRQKDYPNALTRIDAFATAYPTDRRLGKILVYKMGIIGQRGFENQAGMEDAHRLIQANKTRYDNSVLMEADGLLSDFYRKHEQFDKAVDIYVRIIHNFRNVITEAEQKGQPVPAGLEQYHDNAALQLGIIHLQKNELPKAVQWLENVRYDAEIKVKARLALGQTCYKLKDYAQALKHLTADGFLDTVSEGSLKNEMLLLAGLCEKVRPDGDKAKAEAWLVRIPAGQKGYIDARSTLADLYRDRGAFAEAVAAYKVLLDSPHAPRALLQLVQIHFKAGEPKAKEAEGLALLKLSAGFIDTLLTKFPLTLEAKDSREFVAKLQVLGVEVPAAGGSERQLKGWLQSAEENRGKPAGAQALLSLIRHHIRMVKDEKTGKLLKTPDFVAVARFCDVLLNPNVYAGVGFTPEEWKAILGEAKYHRARAELASAYPDSALPREVLIPGAEPARAVSNFEFARAVADPKQIDLIKDIDLGLLEALFKSKDAEHRERAVALYVKLEIQYGQEPRFNRLALEMADWYLKQGRSLDAARAYKGIAIRGRGRYLNSEDVQRIFFTAGSLFSKAGRETKADKETRNFGLHIYPEETVQLSENALNGHPLMRGRKVWLAWPREFQKGPMTGLQAMDILSKNSGIPFVWSSATGPGTVAEHLEKLRIEPLDHPETPAKILARLFDTECFRFVRDIGVTNSKPTLPPPDPEDPQASTYEPVEIYPVALIEQRLPALARPYGEWAKVHAITQQRGAMLFNVLNRIEEVSGLKATWAPGLDKEGLLATEFPNGPPNLAPASEPTCYRVLEACLGQVHLRWRLVARDVAGDLFDEARDCYNESRKIEVKGRYGEKALIAVAIDFYHRQDFANMGAMLHSYLKTFDHPDYEFYRQACFWMGWNLEHERKYREACAWYVRATEERLVFAPLPATRTNPPTAQELSNGLGEDTRFALTIPVNGKLEDVTIKQAIEFIKANTHLSIRLDEQLAKSEQKITVAEIRNLTGLELVIRVAQAANCLVLGENVEPAQAEKAYYRMARCYQSDQLLDQALDACRLLLERYPKSKKRVEVLTLLLEIHKGLKQYGQAMACLEQLRAEAGTDYDRNRYVTALANMRLDIGDYAGSVRLFSEVIATTTDSAELYRLRVPYARAVWRSGDLISALAQYELLVQEGGQLTVPNDLARSIDRLMTYYLRVVTGKVAEHLPEDEAKALLEYEKKSDSERAKLGGSELAKVTWIYFVQGMIDLHAQRIPEAIRRFQAASNSPDDWLAGEAGVRAAQALFDRGEVVQARETLEYILFATRDVEADVRGTALLARCYEALNDPAKAKARYDLLKTRYPMSPFAPQPPPPPKPAEAASGASSVQPMPAASGIQPAPAASGIQPMPAASGVLPAPEVIDAVPAPAATGVSTPAARPTSRGTP